MNFWPFMGFEQKCCEYLLGSRALGARVLIQRGLPSSGHLATSGDMLGCHTGGCYCHLVGKGQGSC